jgi:hypothetical protein
MKMKKVLLLTLVLFLAALAVASIFPEAMTVNIDGMDMDGPAGVLASGFAGGLAIVITGFVLLLVGGILAFAFVGSTVLVVFCLALVAGLLALAAVPLLLPILLPLLFIWGIAKLVRRNKIPAARTAAPSLPQP